MEFNDWIKRQGGPTAAAKVLREKPRTVYSWYRFQKVPSLKKALLIVVRTGGVVDYNGIYGPMARRLVRAEEAA